MQNKEAIFIGHTWNRMVRFAYPRETHLAGQLPGYYGNWISRWDGDSLVLDGTGFNDTTLLDAAGLPHSSELRVVQRLTLKDGGKQLDIHTTFEDAKTFTHPWTALHHYRRVPGALLTEHVCAVRNGG